MNWVVLSLPLAVSVSLVTATAVLYLSVGEILRDVDVPVLRREEPDVAVVKSAFREIFGASQPAGEATKVSAEPESAPEREILLLGVALGKRNMALLRVDREVVVLEEGESRKGILLRRVLPGEAIILTDRGEVRLRLVKGSAPKAQRREEHTTAPSEARISRREIERLTKDPGVMFREIRLVPYVRNGRTEGFIFEWIKPGSLFYRAGLRRGDILVSINNMTINSGEDAFRILQVLRNEPSLRIEVLRNGRRREINVRIE